VLGWSDDGGCWYSKPHIIGIGAAGKQNCRGEVEGFVWGGGPRVGLRTAVQPWAGGRNPDRVVNLFWGGPRVGLRAAVQPWAGGRNPVGIGRGDGFGIEVTGGTSVPPCLLGLHVEGFGIGGHRRDARATLRVGITCGNFGIEVTGGTPVPPCVLGLHVETLVLRSQAGRPCHLACWDYMWRLWHWGHGRDARATLLVGITCGNFGIEVTGRTPVSP
jgi:hypothetical protein